MEKTINSTLAEYCDLIYKTKKPFRPNFHRLDDDEIDRLYDLAQTELLHFTDGSRTVGETLNFYYNHLPSDAAIEAKRGCVRKQPATIWYTFTSSTCVFGAYCSVCDEKIDKAYCGVKPDKNVAASSVEVGSDETGQEVEQTYEGGLTFDEALKKKYNTLGFWTSEEWLLCQSCKNIDEKTEKRFTIVRPFAFYGDLPRGRCRYRYANGNFDITEPSLFREPFFNPVAETSQK